MIDTHIHLIPDVDDGAEDMAMSMEMVRYAMGEGVNEMIVTPHYNTPIYMNEHVDEHFQQLVDQIKKEGLAFKLHLGNEVYLSEESLDGIYNHKAHTMGDSSYLLMELPFHHYYPFHEAMLHDLQINGNKILLAHVERYQVFRKDPHILKELTNRGMYSQLTSRYVVESKTQKRALQWIKEGMIHIIASDAHNIKRRPPMMKEAYKVISNQLGDECARVLCIDNPGRMIMDEPLLVPTVNIKLSGFQGFFKRLI